MSPASHGGLEVEHYIGSSLISASARINPRAGAGGGGYGKGRNKEPGGKFVLPRSVVNQDYIVRNGPIPGMLHSCDCAGYPFRPSPGMGWTGLPLITMAPHHKTGKRAQQSLAKGQQQFMARRSVPEEERTPLSRLAIHTQGVPLILAGKCNNQRKQQLKNNRGDVIPRRNNKYKESRGANAPSDSISVASDESSGSSHSENCLPRIIKPRKRRKKDRKPSVNAPGAEEISSLPQEVAPRSQIGPLPDDESLGPKLHHNFEDVGESELPCPLSSCQCHYCDPSGIWDNPSSDLVLRRSWSEPLPSLQRSLQRSYSLRTPESKDIHWETLKGCDISVKESVPKPPKSSDYRSQCLEVSTEIVTSPNGHRDLEIRFYSASPPS